jgi:hypothetical protein
MTDTSMFLAVHFRPSENNILSARRLKRKRCAFVLPTVNSRMPDDNHTVPQKTWTLKGVLEVLESVSKILAAVAIPFAIAVGSWWIQSSQNTQSVSKDYVNMALSLLQKKPENDQERELRD